MPLVDMVDIRKVCVIGSRILVGACIEGASAPRSNVFMVVGLYSTVSQKPKIYIVNEQPHIHTILGKKSKAIYLLLPAASGWFGNKTI